MGLKPMTLKIGPNLKIGQCTKTIWSLALRSCQPDSRLNNPLSKAHCETLLIIFKAAYYTVRSLVSLHSKMVAVDLLYCSSMLRRWEHSSLILTCIKGHTVCCIIYAPLYFELFQVSWSRVSTLRSDVRAALVLLSTFFFLWRLTLQPFYCLSVVFASILLMSLVLLSAAIISTLFVDSDWWAAVCRMMRWPVLSW